MDIQTRKIQFIQEFLKLESEKAISHLEKLLKKEMQNTPKIKPMSVEELNARLDKSEDDFKNGRYKSTSELLSKYK